jgi:hypothetical protein
MKLRVELPSFAVRDAWTRGSTGLQHLPPGSELLMRLPVQINDREFFGSSAAWMPANCPEDDLKHKRCLAQAAHFAQELRTDSAFQFSCALHRRMCDWAQPIGIPMAAANRAAMLFERCLLDAIACRGGHSLARMVADSRENPLGIDCGQIHPGLRGMPLREFLPARAYQTLACRVALGPHLKPADLPRALRAREVSQVLIRLKHGSSQELAWLAEASQALQGQLSPATGYAIHLGGAFERCAEFFHFWADLRSHPSLEPITRKLVALIEPFQPSIALSEQVRNFFKGWPPKVPVVIDSLNQRENSLPAALEVGYSGVVHRPEAGFFKAIADAGLIALQTDEDRNRQWRHLGSCLALGSPLGFAQDCLAEAVLGPDACTVDAEGFGLPLPYHSTEHQRLAAEALPDLLAFESQHASLRAEDCRIRLGSLAERAYTPGSLFTDAALGPAVALKTPVAVE